MNPIPGADVAAERATDAASLPAAAVGSGEPMHAFCTELYPLLRSITGQGVRDTLAGIARHIPKNGARRQQTNAIVTNSPSESSTTKRGLKISP